MTVRSILPWKKREEEETTDLARSFGDFQREMNRLFESFFADPELGVAAAGFNPAVDVTETDSHVVIKADLPGLTEKDIEVTLEENSLLLKGEKREEKDETRKGIHRIERSYGSFFRRIPLPAEIVNEKVEATFERGVLRIKLPKREEEKGSHRRIEIKTA